MRPWCEHLWGGAWAQSRYTLMTARGGQCPEWGRLDRAVPGVWAYIVSECPIYYVFTRFSQSIKAEFVKCNGKQFVCTFSESIIIM